MKLQCFRRTQEVIIFHDFYGQSSFIYNAKSLFFFKRKFSEILKNRKFLIIFFSLMREQEIEKENELLSFKQLTQNLSLFDFAK